MRIKTVMYYLSKFLAMFLINGKYCLFRDKLGILIIRGYNKAQIHIFHNVSTEYRDNKSIVTTYLFIH